MHFKLLIIVRAVQVFVFSSADQHKRENIKIIIQKCQIMCTYYVEQICIALNQLAFYINL